MLLPETKVYGGRLKDRAKLLKSSSGGAFTALSDVFLKNGNAVVCSTYNYETHQQEYRLIITEKERDSARGSKYVESLPGNIFREAEEWLNANPDKQLLFVGMGCQAAGFQSYIEVTGLRHRTTVVDMICHGSPSPRILREYAKSLEKKQGKINALTFRDKRNGWEYPTAVANINGSEVSLEQYMKIFRNRKAMRLSCHKCPYTTTERMTDITIGDFWHIEDKIPDKYDEMGTSLFIIHTEKGLKLFEEVKNSIDWFESNTTDCWQLNLEKPTELSKERNQFWQDYFDYGIDYIIKKYGTYSFMMKMKRKLKMNLKKILRELYRK